MPTDENYAWNLPPVSRSSSLGATDVLREMVSVVTESLQEKGWSVASISEETRRLDETIREVASSFDGDLAALQLVGAFFLEIKSALEDGLVSQEEGKTKLSVESIAARRIDDSLAAMALLREMYEGFFERLREKGWSEARIIDEGNKFGERAQGALSGFDPNLIRLGRTWVFLQEATLRGSQFRSDPPTSGKVAKTPQEVSAISKVFVNEEHNASGQFPIAPGAGIPTRKSAHKFKDGERVQVYAAGESGKALVGRDIPAMQEFYRSVALGSQGRATEGKQVLENLLASNLAGVVYSGTKAVVLQYAVESGPEELRLVTNWESLVQVRFQDGEVVGLDGWMDDCELEARDVESPMYKNSPVLNKTQCNHTRVPVPEFGRVQPLQGNERAEFVSDGRAILKAAPSTGFLGLIRQIVQVFRRDLHGEDKGIFERWLGIHNCSWTQAHEDAFVRGYERFLYDGHAEDESFRAIQRALREEYPVLRGSAIDIALPAEVRRAYSRLVGGKVE